MEVLKSFLPFISILVVWYALAAYVSKKVKLHKESLVPDNTTPANHLTLSRGVEPTNYLRKYNIYINNSLIGNIASGETKHFQLEPGNHTISLKVDWCKSVPFEFNLIEGSNTKLCCGANYNNWKCLFMHVIKPSKWVYVEVA